MEVMGNNLVLQYDATLDNKKTYSSHIELILPVCLHMVFKSKCYDCIILEHQNFPIPDALKKIDPTPFGEKNVATALKLMVKDNQEDSLITTNINIGTE